MRLLRSRWLTMLGLAFLLLACVGALSSCGLDKATEPYKDSGRGSTNSAKADLITFPDGFNNVATKCDGPNRVYVTYHGDSPYGSITVAPNDPRCK